MALYNKTSMAFLLTIRRSLFLKAPAFLKIENSIATVLSVNKKSRTYKYTK